VARVRLAVHGLRITLTPKEYLMRNFILSFPLFAMACGTADFSPDATQDESELKGSKLTQAMDVTKLVANTSDAARVDRNMKNAWGIAFNPVNGAAWVSNTGTGTSGVYDASGNTILTVHMPQDDGPTAQLFNASSAFMGDKFITVSEAGNIMGWQRGTTAVLRVHSDTASYKGAAIAVDMYNSSYQLQACAGGFADASMPADFAPFNVWEYEGYLFVSYAKPDAEKHDDVKGAGNGFVNVFDSQGVLKQRLVSRGALNSPWGMAITEAQTGSLAKETLLIGNFGDGKINAFELSDAIGGGFRAKAKGALANGAGQALVIDGLWGLANDTQGRLWFTAGPNSEENGLLGRLSVHVIAPPRGGGY
jgi:uncharacterized protein (TIGR03118 family)